MTCLMFLGLQIILFDMVDMKSRSFKVGSMLIGIGWLMNLVLCVMDIAGMI